MQPAKHTFTPCLINGRIRIVNNRKLPDDIPSVDDWKRAKHYYQTLNPEKRNIPAIENFFSQQNKKGPSNV